MNLKFVTKALLLTVASISFMHAAVAQWQWIDKDGRKVFSDRAPAADIPQKSILKQPGMKSAAPSPEADGSAPPAPGPVPAAKASAPKLAAKDAQLEARKKQAEDEENARKKEEEAKVVKAKADNCERAKRGLATVQSGVRLSVTNAKGEREIMDDSARAVESKRLQAIADSDCAK